MASKAQRNENQAGAAEQPPITWGADLFIISTGFENAIRIVRDLAPELTWHGQINAAAVWSVGNCRIGLWARTETTSQMEIKVFRALKVGGIFTLRRDDAARVACDALVKRLQSAELVQPYPDSERIAKETLSTLHMNEDSDQAEIEQFANTNAAQAAADFLARFGTPNASTSAGPSIDKIVVPIDRRQTFPHLLALCNRDGAFCIFNSESMTDEQLEHLIIGDTQAIQKAGGEAKGNIIGTVRLLPLGSRTCILFDSKDAFFHLPVSDHGTTLFREFHARVKAHFEGIAFQGQLNDRDWTVLEKGGKIFRGYLEQHGWVHKLDAESVRGTGAVPESPTLSKSHPMELPPLSPQLEMPRSAPANAQEMSNGPEGEKEVAAGNIIVARMHIRAGLSAVRDAINGYARDGIILSPGLTASLELREFLPLRKENRAVWCVGHSAIVAEHRAETLTELKMLAVKRIMYDDGTAHREWRFLESEFKNAGLWQKSESIWEDGVAGIQDVLDERKLIEGARPELGDEQQYKDQWRASFQANPIINKGLSSQRKLTPEQIESEVEQLWEIHCRHVEESQYKWQEIHRFQGLMTEQATLGYFAEPTGRTRQSVIRHILSALSPRVHLGFLSLAVALWLVVIAYSVIVYPTWIRSTESTLVLVGLGLGGVVSFVASLRKAFEPSPRKQ